jgi:hypothetical protein
VKFFKNFGTRIAEIGVVVTKIWQKEFRGLICNFWKVAKGIFGNIFENQGSSWKFKYCGLIVEKGRGLNEKWLEYLVFKLFSNRKWHGLSPWHVEQRRARSMVDQPPWAVVELIGAQPSGRSRPWHLAMRWGKEGGHPGESILASTKAWKAARRRCTGGGTSTQNGNGVGTAGAKRRIVGGVGSSLGGAAFCMAEARRQTKA